MTMDCPRCGFNQPKDRFCANCGLDVDHFVPRRIPLWTRISSRPLTYVVLAGALLALVSLFILTAYAPAIRGVRGQFVTSRDAAEPDDDDDANPEVGATTAATKPAPTNPPPTDPAPEPAPPPATESTATAALPVVAVNPAAAPAPKMIEAEFWEVARGPTLRILSTGDRVAEDQDARAILLREPDKTHEWLHTAARPLGAPFHGNLRDGTQIVIETPAGTPEPFHFAMMLQLTKWADGRASLRFASPQALDGTAELVAGESLVIVIEPRNRRHPPEVVAKAGPGPWAIFASPNFRAGETAWIFTVHLR